MPGAVPGLVGMLSTCELEILTGLIKFYMVPSWMPCEWLQQALGHFWQALCQKLKLPPQCCFGMSRARVVIFWAPSQCAFKHSLAYCESCFDVMNVLSFNLVPFLPWYLPLGETTLYLLKLLSTWDWSSSQYYELWMRACKLQGSYS